MLTRIHIAAAGLWLALGLALPAAVGPAPRVSGTLVSSPEPGWPQWRGVRRDGISDERGLLAAWPESGPPKRWSVVGMGKGFSSPIISGQRMYLTGDFGKELHVLAMDLAGRIEWRATNGASWTGAYPGARACCAYSQGRVFHRNAHGRVACFDAGTGRELWAVDTLERFAGRNVEWAMGECLLVDGSNVIVTAGGSKALLAALDARTGDTVWTSDPVWLEPDPADPETGGRREADRAGYGSPILVELSGRRVILGASWRNLYAVDAAHGRLLWSAPMRTSYSVVPMCPVWCGDGWFLTAPDAKGGRFYALPANASTDRSLPFHQEWTTRLDTCHGGVIFAEGGLHGSWYRAGKGWSCVDVATGAIRFGRDEFAKGSLIHADGRFYGVGEDGEAFLLGLIPDGAAGYLIHGRFRWVRANSRDAWAHPVILDGRLYLRYHDTLDCFDIRAAP